MAGPDRPSLSCLFYIYSLYLRVKLSEMLVGGGHIRISDTLSRFPGEGAKGFITNLLEVYLVSRASRRETIVSDNTIYPVPGKDGICVHMPAL